MCLLERGLPITTWFDVSTREVTLQHQLVWCRNSISDNVYLQLILCFELAKYLKKRLELLVACSLKRKRHRAQMVRLCSKMNSKGISDKFFLTVRIYTYLWKYLDWNHFLRILPFRSLKKMSVKIHWLAFFS